MRCLSALIVAFLLTPLIAHSAEMTIFQPTDFQVIQRFSGDTGTVQVTGQLDTDVPATAIVEARTVSGGTEAAWQPVEAKFSGRDFSGNLGLPAGGWYRLQLRLSDGGTTLAQSTIEHVGIGEVFVVAGQSNSANHGEVKQITHSKRVATFDGRNWRLADDPQPGASGKGGSFMPPLGDELVRRFDVPVGFVACGIGATSVREWLPKGTTFPNPPTIEGRVTKTADGQWASKGAAFDQLVSRMKPLGPHGFRAVLWHQGVSDANQQDATRTLPGDLYRQYLEKVIVESRRQIGWDAPWFVAQASYHIPGDEDSPDIRAAQASLWKSGIALEGPDTDALKGDLRERNGKGVHFSDQGLHEHAMKWAEKIEPWIERELAPLRRRN
jgi:hypothetical protein